MILCQRCGEEVVDEVVVVKIGRKRVRVCPDCHEVLREEAEVAKEAEGAMQEMMEYKGR